MVLEILQKEVARARDCQSSLGVALIKVDHFEMIRDVYGRRAAEEVLREAARLVSSSIRPYDSAGRYDENEFLLVVPNFDGESMTALAEQVRKSLAATPVRVSGETIAFTVSVGVVAESPSPDQDADRLTKLLRDTLSQAGKGDGNRVATGPAVPTAVVADP